MIALEIFLLLIYHEKDAPRGFVGSMLKIFEMKAFVSKEELCIYSCTV